MRATILNNQYSFGTDTPVYEKGGWTNDNWDFAASEMANFDAEAYYVHMMQNFDDAQDVHGNVGDLVPAQPAFDRVDPVWGGSFILIEHAMFENYDDLAVVRRDYSHMAAYLEMIKRMIARTGYVYLGWVWGDWLIPRNENPPSSQLLGSEFIYLEARDLAIMAHAIGRQADAARYEHLASNVAAAVNAKFYDSSSREYRDPPHTPTTDAEDPIGYAGPCSVSYPDISTCGYQQTPNVLALAFGLAPEVDRQAILNGLAADVSAKGDHLATGVQGSKFILRVLTENRQGDLAYKVATNRTAPSWRYWFAKCGATTMWEGWYCDARSHDHALMGTVDDWLLDDVAGIQPTSPGFRTIQIRPFAVGDLSSGAGYRETPLGQVSSSWTRSGNRFSLTVQIPVGATASVYVPAQSARAVVESGDPINAVKSVHLLGKDGPDVKLGLGSGTYRFSSTTA